MRSTRSTVCQKKKNGEELEKNVAVRGYYYLTPTLQYANQKLLYDAYLLKVISQKRNDKRYT